MYMTHCKAWYEDALKCSVYNTEKTEGFSFQADCRVPAHDSPFWGALST